MNVHQTDKAVRDLPYPRSNRMKSSCLWRAAVLLSVSLSPELASAQTEVSGIQSGKWTIEGSPYILVGDVVVSATDTLTIDPGVHVLSDGYHRITVEGGELVAVGTPEAPIMMTAMDPRQGWGGIRLFSASDESKFEHCRFEYAKNFGPNLESRGGALRAEECSPTIRFNEFRHGSSHNDNFNGGGAAVYLQLSSALVAYNVMISNSADNGGAIRAGDWGSPVIRGNIVIGNYATRDGGGMYIGARSTAIVENNIVIGNQSGPSGHGGGGITSWTGFHLYGTFSLYRNNLIAFNTAANEGGGMYLRYDRGIITNNLIAFNSAAYGGGVHAVNFPSSAPILSNDVIWGNSASVEGPQINLIEATGSEINVSYSIVQGGWPGVGNIDADPMFISIPSPGPDGEWGTDDDELGNLRVRPGSPAIGAGDPFLTDDPGETDLDGHARVLCELIDMGPYEFGIGDYDCNQSVTLDDYAIFTQCLTGPNGGPLDPGCDPFDFNADAAIDLRDFAGFQRAFMESVP